MGTSTDAILAYGWALDEDTGDLLDLWAEVHAVDLEQVDVITAMLRVLYGKIPDAHPGVSDYDVELAVEEHYGIRFETHCSSSCPMWLLAAHVVKANRGYPEAVDITSRLAGPELRADYDAKLHRVLQVLGIDPTVLGKPRWLLASYWSG